MKKITIIKSISPKVCSESGHQPFRCGRPKLSVYPYKINMLTRPSYSLLFIKIYWQPPLFVGKNAGFLHSA